MADGKQLWAQPNCAKSANSRQSGPGAGVSGDLKKEMTLLKMYIASGTTAFKVLFQLGERNPESPRVCCSWTSVAFTTQAG